MDTSKSSIISSKENLIYLDAPDIEVLYVAHGLITEEALERAKQEYHAWLTALETEWPPNRVKQAILEEFRRKCEWTLKKRETLEISNRDARSRGVSYAERKKTSSQIEALTKLFNEYKARGLEYKKRNDIYARNFLTPLDVIVCEEKGFEHILRVFIM